MRLHGRLRSVASKAAGYTGRPDGRWHRGLRRHRPRPYFEAFSPGHDPSRSAAACLNISSSPVTAAWSTGHPESRQACA